MMAAAFDYPKFLQQIDPVLEQHVNQLYGPEEQTAMLSRRRVKSVLAELAYVVLTLDIQKPTTMRRRSQ